MVLGSHLSWQRLHDFLTPLYFFSMPLPDFKILRILWGSWTWVIRIILSGELDSSSMVFSYLICKNSLGSGLGRKVIKGLLNCCANKTSHLEKTQEAAVLCGLVSYRRTLYHEIGTTYKYSLVTSQCWKLLFWPVEQKHLHSISRPVPLLPAYVYVPVCMERGLFFQAPWCLAFFHFIWCHILTSIFDQRVDEPRWQFILLTNCRRHTTVHLSLGYCPRSLIQIQTRMKHQYALTLRWWLWFPFVPVTKASGFTVFLAFTTKLRNLPLRDIFMSQSLNSTLPISSVSNSIYWFISLSFYTNVGRVSTKCPSIFIRCREEYNGTPNNWHQSRT